MSENYIFSGLAYCEFMNIYSFFSPWYTWNTAKFAGGGIEKLRNYFMHHKMQLSNYIFKYISKKRKKYIKNCQLKCQSLFTSQISSIDEN